MWATIKDKKSYEATQKINARNNAFLDHRAVQRDSQYWATTNGHTVTNRYDNSCTDKVPKYQAKVSTYEGKVHIYPEKVPTYQEKVPTYQEKVPTYQEKMSNFPQSYQNGNKCTRNNLAANADVQAVNSIGSKNGCYAAYPMVDVRNAATKGMQQAANDAKFNKHCHFQTIPQHSLMRVDALHSAGSLKPVHEIDTRQMNGAGKWDQVITAKDDLLRQKDVVVDR